MDIADLNGCDFRRRLRSADRLSERAMALGLLLANTPRSRSSASLFCPTAADHFRGEGFADPPDLALAISATPNCLCPAVSSPPHSALSMATLVWRSTAPLLCFAVAFDGVERHGPVLGHHAAAHVRRASPAHDLKRRLARW